jgi:hypothetical protein
MTVGNKPRWYVYLLVPILGGLAGGWLWMQSAVPPEAEPVPTQTLTIAYTTDTRGYLQECGCVAQQVGGLARRATRLRALRAQAAPYFLLLEGGNLAEDLTQAQVVLEVLRLLAYDVVGLGEQDVRLGPALYQEALRRSLPVTVCPSPADCPKEIPFYHLCKVGGYRIGVWSLVPSAATSALAQVSSWLQGEGAQVHGVLIFSSLGAEEEKQLETLLAGTGAMAAIISRQVRVDASLERKGHRIWLPACAKGEIGLIQVHPDPASGWSMSYRRERVTTAVPADAQVQSLVQSYYAEQAEQLLLASALRTVTWTQIGYRPAQLCRDCHPAQVEAWQRSKHAQAVQTLQEQGRLVPACLRCHSELYRRTQKYHPQVLGAGNGVECASCHGDGVLHAALGSKGTIRRQVPVSTCRHCHDAENDPRFVYEEYRGMIRHWWEKKSSEEKGGTNDYVPGSGI